MKVKDLGVADLSQDPANARKHNPKNIDAIKASLTRFGQQKPIVVDAKGVVIAGNGTLEAARLLGWDKIKVVESELKGSDRTAYGIADNRSSELAEWDLPVLGDLLQGLREDGFEIGDIGFDVKDLDDLGIKQEYNAKCDEDEVPETVEPVCKRGEIYQLGNHRLLCGDSTSKEDVERLMAGEKADMVFTDPPYGVAVVNGQGGIIGDENLSVFENSLPVLKTASKDNAHVYVFCAAGDMLPRSIAAFVKVFPFQNLLPIRCTHENKRGPKGAFKHNYEVCLFGNNNERGFYKTNKIKVSQTTLDDQRYEGDGRLSVYPALWDGERATEHNLRIVHPTQKNVALIEFYLDVSSKSGQTVIDLFLGSGSTLIACEKTNRRCFGMEIDPHYCDVIIERYKKFTGRNDVKKAT
jgi:DNA modification methylase